MNTSRMITNCLRSSSCQQTTQNKKQNKTEQKLSIINASPDSLAPVSPLRVFVEQRNHTQQPHAVTQQPYGVTQSPHVVTQRPYAVTQQPYHVPNHDELGTKLWTDGENLQRAHDEDDHIQRQDRARHLEGRLEKPEHRRNEESRQRHHVDQVPRDAEIHADLLHDSLGRLRRNLRRTWIWRPGCSQPDLVIPGNSPKTNQNLVVQLKTLQCGNFGR